MGSSRALRWLLLVVLLGAVAAVLRSRRSARLEWERTWPAAVPPSTRPPDALAPRRRPTRAPAARALPAPSGTTAPQPAETGDPVTVPAGSRTAPSPKPRPRPAAPAAQPGAPAAEPDGGTAVPATQLRPRRPHLTLPETAAFAGPDGSPPGPEYTIKAKSGSTLFHGPDSPYFSRTRAEFWFRTAADARAAGLTEWTPRRRGRS